MLTYSLAALFGSGAILMLALAAHYGAKTYHQFFVTRYQRRFGVPR